MTKNLLFVFILLAISYQLLARDIAVYISATNKSTKDSITAAANDLINELKKAGSFDFDIKESENAGSTGIFFVLHSGANKMNIDYPLKLRSYNAEGYYIKSSANRLVFIGNSSLALQQAVFDYLEQLGFRYFMPGEVWNIVPSLSTPFIDFEKLTQPLYEFRTFSNGHGYYRNKKVENDFNFWAKTNRLGGSFPIRIGHSYQTIVTNNLEEFRRHPEYFADKKDKSNTPVTAKFNVANQQLVDLVIKDAKQRLSVFRKTGQFMNMISMEPSDGGGFCTTAECQKIGSISDQVFYLTNSVAKAIQAEYPGVWVGTLAYNEHIEPTKYELEPNVFVMITNGFNRTKFTTRQLIERWNNKAGKTGIYEYLSVFAWDNDLPGRAYITDLEYLKKSIRDYYEGGARIYQGETNVGWINKGLGQYIAARLLWNYNVDIDSIADDFYKKAFGNAAPPIRKLFRSWEKSSNGMISDNALAEWLALVSEADKMTNDNKIERRLSQIKIYLHYLVLYKKLKTNPTVDNLNKIMRFAFQTFDASAFATVPVMTSLPFYTGFKGYGIYDKNDHPWMSDARQLTTKDIDYLFKEDILSVRRIEGMRSFDQGKKFSKPKIGISQKVKPDNPSPSFTGETAFLLKISKLSPENYFEIKSGYAARPPDDRRVAMKIYKYTQYLELKNEADVVFSAEQSAKLVNEKISLESLGPGDYILTVDDQAKMFSIGFSSALHYSVIMDAEKPILTSSVTGLNTFYFSVPQDVEKFIIYKTKVLKLLSPAGRILEFTTNKQESIVVEVKENEKGLWQIFGQAGNLMIEGVPPYLGIKASSMLLPSE